MKKNCVEYYGEDDKVELTEFEEKLNLSLRAINCLKRAGYTTVEQLHNVSIREFMKVRNLGRKSMKEILKALDEYYNTDEHMKKYYDDVHEQNCIAYYEEEKEED